MATIGELNILLGGDAASFDKAIQQGQKDLEQLSRAFILAGKNAEKFNLGMLNVLSRQQGDIGKFSTKLKDDLNVIAQGLVNQGQASSVTEKGIRNLAAAQIVNANESKKAAEAVKQSQKEQADAMKMAEKAAREYEQQIKSVSNSLWLMNNALQQIGISLTAAFTVPIVGAATVAIKTFTDWERGTVAIQRSAEITREEADKITQSFVEISQQVPLTVEELQKAGFAAAQAGVKGEEGITNFAVAAAKLSKVGGDAFKDLSLDQLADTLAKVSIAFGVTGENMENVERIASALLGVAKDVPGGLGEVSEALRRVAGFASNAGLSFETTTALVGTLIAAAVPAERAGTELGRVISEMTKNVDKLAEVLGYGTDGIDDLKDRMDKDLNGVMLETIQRLSQVESAQDRATIAFELFGEVGSKAFLPLVNNTELVNSLLERSQQEFKDGTLLARDFAVQANSLGGTFKVFQNNVLALAKALGDDLAPYINLAARLMIDFLQKAIAFWKGLDPTIKGAVIALGAFLAILGPATLLLKTLFVQPLSGVVTFITFLTRLSQNMGTLLGILGITNSQLVLMRAASIAAATGNTQLAVSMATAAGAGTGLLATLGALLASLLPVVGAVLAVVAALALLSKAFGVGIKFKLPSVESPNLKPSAASKLPAADQTQLEDIEGASEAEKAAGEKREKELEKEIKEKRKLFEKEIRAIQDGIDLFEKARNAELKALQKSVDEQRDAIDARRDLWDDEREALQEQIDAQKELVDNAKDAAKEAKKVLDQLKKARKGEIDAAEGQVDLAKASLEAAQNALKREKLLGRDEFDASFRAAEERVKVAEETLQLAQENVVRLERLQNEEIAAQEEIVENAENHVDNLQEGLDDLQAALDQREKIVKKELDLLNDELELRQDALDDYREASGEKLDVMKDELNQIKRAHDDEIDLLQDRLDEIKDQNAAIADMGLPTLPDLPDAYQKLWDEIDKQTAALGDIGGQLKFDPGGFGLDIEEGGAFSKILKGDILGGLEEGLTNLGRMIVTPVLDTIFGKGFTKGLEEDARKHGTNVAYELWNSFSDNTKLLLLQTPLGQLLFANDAIIDLQKKAEEAGLSVPDYIWQGITTKLTEIKEAIIQTIFDSLFGEGAWETISTEAQNRGQSIPQTLWEGFTLGISNIVETVKTAIDQTFLQPIRDFAALTPEEAAKAGADAGTALAEAIKGKIEDVKTAIKEWVDGLKAGIQEKWEEIKTAGAQIIDQIWAGITSKATEFANNVTNFIKNSIPEPIKKLLGITEDSGKQIGESVDKGVQKGGQGTRQSATSIIQNFISGITGQRGAVQSAVSGINSVIGGLSGLISQAYSWGSNLGAQLANGIANSRAFVENAVKYVNNLISNFWRSFSPPKHGVLKDIDTWGVNLTKTFADGIASGSSSMSAAVNKVGEVIEENLAGITIPDVALAPVVGGIGTNISAEADQASIPALAREAALADQDQAQPQTVVNRTYNIQPGQMIASRGEIRSFVRMLKEYEEVENQR